MKDHLDSVSIQKLSDRVFDAYYKWVCKKGGKPRFKSWKNGIRSMEGKSNTCLSEISPRISNRLFLTSDVVGRYGEFLTVLTRRPLYWPACICMRYS